MTTTLEAPTVKPAGHESLVRLASLGTRYLYADLVAEALKLELPTPPECPLSEEEVKAIFAHGSLIIWCPARCAVGNPITMERIYTHLGNKAPLGGQILWKVDWYAPEEFYTTHTARSDKSGLGSWREVSTIAIPGTEGENALNRTLTAAKYVETKIYHGKLPERLRQVFGEPRQKAEEIARLAASETEWPQANKMLADLAFNRMFSATPAELMMLSIVCQSANGVYILVGKYAVTYVCSWDGYLVNFGDAVGSGAGVSRWHPRAAGSGDGFFLSRDVGGEDAS